MALPPMKMPRQEFAAVLGDQQVLLNYLDRLGVEINALVTSGGANSTSLVTILADVAALYLLVAKAQRTADQTPLWLRPSLSAAQVLALVDTSLLTEGGDTLFTEGGDSLFLEA